MEDGLLYQNGKIKITKNIFSNGKGENFIVASIRSLRDERSSKTKIFLFLALIGAVAAVFVKSFPYSQYILGGAGALFLLIHLMQKETYTLYITNPQGEVVAFRSTQADDFNQITRYLKKAVSLHQ